MSSSPVYTRLFDLPALQSYLAELLDIRTDSVWVVQLFLVILATLALHMAARLVLRRMEAKLTITRNTWDDALIGAVRAPLATFILFAGIGYALEIIAHNTSFELIQFSRKLVAVLFVLMFGWFLIRFIHRAEGNILEANREKPEDRRFDRGTLDAIAKLLRTAVIITMLLVCMQTLGIPISGVLAFGGVGGIAVGFAAKDLLANFFGALMIYLDRPFQIGDWVRSPDRDIEGTVEAIGWRLTRIRTFDKRPLYVPNAVFSTVAVENPSRMSHRRIYETIGVRYDDIGIVAALVEDIRDMLREHPEIDERQTLIVNVNAYAPSSVDFFVYTFTHTTNWVRFHEIKQDILLRIAGVIARHGAEIAFPTSTVHVPSPVSLDWSDGQPLSPPSADSAQKEISSPRGLRKFTEKMRKNRDE